MKYFEEHFLWNHQEDDVLFLDDGATAMIWEYRGWDFSLSEQQHLIQARHQLTSLVHQLPAGYYAEFHLLRSFDNAISDCYRKQPLVRAQAVCQWFRNKLADQVRQSEMSNRLYMVLTKLAINPANNPARRLAQQHKAAQELKAVGATLVRHLPEARLTTLAACAHIIGFSYAPPKQVIDEGGLKHYWMCQGKPSHDHAHQGLLRLPDGRYTATLVLQFYPDCDHGWIAAIVGSFGEAHAVQTITPASDIEILKSKKAEDLAQALSSSEGAEQAAVIAGDQRDLRAHIAEHQLKLFKNNWSIALFDKDPDALHKRLSTLIDLLHHQGAQVRHYPEMQLATWFYQLPAQGHLLKRSRVDETWQVVAMTPCQSFYQGRVDAPFMLRLGVGFQGVALGYQSGEVAHHCTIAVTGAGKSLDRCARIIECYGLGIDMYLLEIGKSGWWAIESVGGEYFAVDPDRDAINPLPPRSCLNDHGELPQDIISVTVSTLAFLLKQANQEEVTLTAFERTSVQLALIQCYHTTAGNPTLIDLKDALAQVNHPDLPQVATCAKQMSDHLSAFLMSVEGKKFMGNSELTLSPGACGIDLSLVRSKAPNLLKFYLVFVALKFGQMASANKQPAEIILDETHEFVRLAPEVMKPLIEGLARMGRKEASFIDLITQEMNEIDAVGRAVINQMQRKTLLYRTSDHEQLAIAYACPKKCWTSGKAGTPRSIKTGARALSLMASNG